MRRSITMLVVLAMLVVAPPANAGKPEKPSKPKPPGQGVLEVSVTANLWAVNIPGDEIEYSIVVTNRGSDDAEVTVTDDLLGLDETFDLPAGESWPLEPLERPFQGTYEVLETDFGTDKILNTVVATIADSAERVEATATVEVWPAQECEWSDEGVLSEDSMAGDDAVPCFWTEDTEYWKLTAATATGKPTRVLLTMRDHFPGNWCEVPETSNLEPSGATSGMARPGDPLTLHVYFPPSGICLAGGAGGNEMGVGTLGTYYLVAMGDVTVTRTAP